MNIVKCAIGMSVAGVVVLAASLAWAGDWPQWRGPNRDGKAASFTAPKAWPKELTQKWTVKVASADATPALVGDKLYVFGRDGADETLLCLEAATGKVVWQDKYAAPAIRGPAAPHAGPRSSPAVADGKVVALGVGAMLSCLDAQSGKVLWRKDTAKDFPERPMFYTACSPMIVDGLCVVQIGGQGKGAVAAYDLAGGEIKWQTPTDGTTYSSPVLMTADGIKQVVAQGEKSLMGVSLADGKLLWRVEAPTVSRTYNAPTPIVDGQTVYYTGGGKGTKAYKIEKQDGGFAAKEIWSNSEIGCNFSTPVLRGGQLFGMSDKGSFFCLDAKTGKTLWSSEKRGERGFGSIVDAGSVLLATNNKGDFIAFAPSEKEYTELANIKVAQAPLYAHPVVDGNRVFIQDQAAVTAFTID